MVVVLLALRGQSSACWLVKSKSSSGIVGRVELLVSVVGSGSEIVAARALILDTSTELGRAKTWGVRSINGSMMLKRKVNFEKAYGMLHLSRRPRCDPYEASQIPAAGKNMRG